MNFKDYVFREDMGIPKILNWMVGSIQRI